MWKPTRRWMHLAKIDQSRSSEERAFWGKIITYIDACRDAGIESGTLNPKK